MKSATRSLLFGLVLVLLFVVTAASGVIWQTGRTVHAAVMARLQSAATVENDLQASRLQELQLRAVVLAQDPAFVDYVAQSLIPNPQLGGAVDSVSISDLLNERRHGYDIAMVLDRKGKPIATSGIFLKNHASIQNDPMVVKAIGTLKPMQGAWVDHGQLLWVAVNPLLRSGALQGVLITATHVDTSFVIAIGRIAHTDVSLLLPPSAGAPPAPSTNPDNWISQALEANQGSMLDIASARPWSLADAQHRTTAWVTPLPASAGHAVLVALDPDASSSGLIAETAWPLLFAVGGFGLLGVMIVLLQWRRTWLPLQEMLRVVRLAENGDQNLTVRVDGSPIVRSLRDSINTVLHGDYEASE